MKFIRRPLFPLSLSGADPVGWKMMVNTKPLSGSPGRRFFIGGALRNRPIVGALITMGLSELGGCIGKALFYFAAVLGAWPQTRVEVPPHSLGWCPLFAL